MKRTATPGARPHSENATAQLVRAAKGDRQFVNALARGLQVLRAFKPHDQPLSNLELAKRTGMPRPTISRLTYTLTELGYLTYHEQFGCYELGGGALILGHVARTNFNAVSKIRPVMERLAEFSGANVGLGTRERLNMVYVEACQGPSLVGLRLNIGSHVPIVSSAMGRAYLAGISAEERANLGKQLKREPKIEEAQFQREVEVAMKDMSEFGFCLSAGDWQRDIHGVALSIATPQLGSAFVLNCGGPAYLLPRDRLITEIGPKLIHAVNEIKQALGTSVRINGSPAGSEALCAARKPDPRPTPSAAGASARAVALSRRANKP